MATINTFSLHYVLRRNKAQHDKFPIYARITVNKTRCELALKEYISPADWNAAKGLAKPKNDQLKQLNSYLEKIRAGIVQQYRMILCQDVPITAHALKTAFMGGAKEKAPGYTLLGVVARHNALMQKVLKKGSMKNYYTTEKYLKWFINTECKATDFPLKQLTYEFITTFECFIRSHPLKDCDPCTNNGTMKHLERLKKIVAWAVKNEWLDKNPFTGFKLKYKRKERDYLTEPELTAIESQPLDNPALQKVRDLFVFSCYTGLAYVDLMALQPAHIIYGVDGMKWIRTCRTKTETSVHVPLLKPALRIVEKYANFQHSEQPALLFPKVSNQEMNQSLKIIAEICGILKNLTFHLARHTFATTVTLMNGVPIETISKMLGHTKLSTTMIYARVTHSKIGMDMSLLQNKLDSTENKHLE